MTEFLGMSINNTQECDLLEAYESEEESQYINNPYNFETCSHLQVSIVDGSNVCNECGMKIDESLVDNETRYFGACDSKFNKDPTRHHQRKDEERSLYYDLQPLNIPQKVIEIAKRELLNFILNIAAAKEPVQAPVVGNGMATNSTNPQNSYFSTIFALHFVLSSNQLKNLRRKGSLLNLSLIGENNKSSIGTGRMLPIIDAIKA